MEEILEQLQKMLDGYNVKYYVPPVAQNSEVDLTASFSFKFAAVNAGLGWSGKMMLLSQSNMDQEYDYLRS